MNISKERSTRLQMLPDDILSRFLFYQSDVHQTTRTIKTSVFSKKYPKGFSVFKTTGKSHDEIWKTGKKHAAPGYENQTPPRPLYGRFDLQAHHYMESELNIALKEPPPDHYNIFGMPVPSAEIGKELNRRQQMVNKAKTYLLNERKEWKKYAIIKKKA